MDAATLFLAVVIGGVNFGWQSAGDGTTGYEYIVQVEPELVDAMQRGESIPIESNIPSEVSPIRKVRVVVGRGELPRSPLRHTANFAGQAGWTQDSYPAGATAPSSSGRYPLQEQSVLSRTQTAVTETGTAISDGVQAGMRSAQEQFSRAGSQVTSDAQNAAQQFNQQMQSTGNSLRSATEQTFNSTSNSIQQAGNSLGLTGNSATTGAGGVSAPPWPQSNSAATAPQFSSTSSPTSRSAVVDTTASPGMAMTRTATGWTSIGTNVAAPPLLNPPIPTAADVSANQRLAQSSTSGPMLSAPTPTAATNREPLHSPLVDPSRQQAGADTANNWGNSWGTGAAAAAPATIGRSNDASRNTNAAGGLGSDAVQPRYPTQTDPQQAANRWGDPWTQNDPWTQQQQQNAMPENRGGTTNSGQLATSGGWPANSANPAGTNAAGQQVIGQAPPAPAGFAGTAPPAGNVAGANPAGGNGGLKPVPTAEQMPWMPLLLTTLGLVGSLSANFYLALSYIGARQKYVSLVQKTADTFRRATGAASVA